VPRIGARELCPEEAARGSRCRALISPVAWSRLLGAHAEDAPRARAPEEHLEHQDVHVQTCNEEDESFRRRSSSDSLPGAARIPTQTATLDRVRSRCVDSLSTFSPARVLNRCPRSPVRVRTAENQIGPWTPTSPSASTPAAAVPAVERFQASIRAQSLITVPSAATVSPVSHPAHG